MKKICLLSLFVALFSFTWISPAFADTDIWGKLATIAGQLGGGLQKSGFLIGGIGLAFFSFMAIFNKISWKNLAYIMLSCFVLSAMVGLLNYFSKEGTNVGNVTENTFNGPEGQIEFPGGISQAGGTNPK